MIGGLTEFDEKVGRELFAEIMEGVNFGHASAENSVRGRIGFTSLASSGKRE